MFKFFFWLLAFVLLTFAVVNRQEVAVSLWPLPYDMIAPLSLVLFCAFALGFFVGMISKRVQALLEALPPRRDGGAKMPSLF